MKRIKEKLQREREERELQEALKKQAEELEKQTADMIRLEQEIALGIIGGKDDEEQDDNDDDLLGMATPRDKQDDLGGESTATVNFPPVPDVLVTEDDDD